jgi:hypothetical protein
MSAIVSFIVGGTSWSAELCSAYGNRRHVNICDAVLLTNAAMMHTWPTFHRRYLACRWGNLQVDQCHSKSTCRHAHDASPLPSRAAREICTLPSSARLLAPDWAETVREARAARAAQAARAVAAVAAVATARAAMAATNQVARTVAAAAMTAAAATAAMATAAMAMTASASAAAAGRREAAVHKALCLQAAARLILDAAASLHDTNLELPARNVQGLQRLLLG